MPRLGPFVFGAPPPATGYWCARRVLGTGRVSSPFLFTSWQGDDDRESLAIARAERLRPYVHPGILRTLQVGRVGALSFEAVEGVDGVSVRNMLGRHDRLPFSASIGCAIQLLDMAAALHEKDCTLGMVKSEYVYWARSGRVALVPRKSENPSQQSDVFQIGMLLRIMLSGDLAGKERVRVAKGFSKILQQTLRGLLAEDASKRPDALVAHDELCDILERHKNRSARSLIASFVNRLPQDNNTKAGDFDAIELSGKVVQVAYPMPQIEESVFRPVQSGAALPSRSNGETPTVSARHIRPAPKDEYATVIVARPPKIAQLSSAHSVEEEGDESIEDRLDSAAEWSEKHAAAPASKEDVASDSDEETAILKGDKSPVEFRPTEPSYPLSSLASELGLASLLVDAPEHARIYLDGVEVGQGRVLIDDLERFRSYSLRVHQRGFAPWSKTVELGAQTRAKVAPKLRPR